MATPMTRELQITGKVMSTPSAATITVNGVELFSGQIGVGQPIDTVVVLATMTYNGQDFVETFPISISITSGVAKLGQFFVNNASPSGFSRVYNETDDGRQNILINGLPPEWPATPVDPMPGGTAENPNWSGYLMEVSAGETMLCDYEAADVSSTS